MGDERPVGSPMARGRAGAGVATKRRAPRQAPVRWLAGALAGIVAWALAGPGHAGAAQSGYRQVRQFRAGLAHARGAVGADGAIPAGDRAVIRCGRRAAPAPIALSEAPVALPWPPTARFTWPCSTTWRPTRPRKAAGPLAAPAGGPVHLGALAPGRVGWETRQPPGVGRSSVQCRPARPGRGVPGIASHT